MAWIEQTGQHAWRVHYPHGHSHYGSVSGFTTAKAARHYANDLESDRRRGQWIDPASAKTTVSTLWVETLAVETRTEENYRAYLRNHITPRWGYTSLGDITSLEVTAWLKDLRKRYAASTVDGILTVFSMMLDDAVDQRLIPANPVRRRRRRGPRRRRRDRWLAEAAECRAGEGGEREHGRFAPQDLRSRDRRHGHRLDLGVGARLISVDLQEHVADAQGRALVKGDDDLLHIGQYRGDDHRRHRVYRMRLTRVPLPGGLVHTTDRRRIEHCLGPPGLGTWIVKSKRHVVAIGDLDATETVGPMTSSERCRA